MANVVKDKFVGKRLSFAQLYSYGNFVVEIPTIQRDYAQGRKNKSEIRELFLQALFDYLEENKPNRDLDFVYGSTELSDEQNKFVPLDGQQRLTTLFLLHFYLATLSGNEEHLNKLLFKDDKSKFSYLTRPSSGEFVDALLKNSIDLTNLLDSDKGLNNSLSNTIKDKGWFFLSWRSDPTIQSMLTMLDSIHNKFKGKPYFYNRLVDNENPIITFLFLDLKEFKLSEDLYIKMNSRGKPLTSFENFKAKLEQHIRVIFGNKKELHQVSTSNPVSYSDYFSYQIDKTWADLFWQYRELVGKPHTYDEELMNYLRVIISNQYAIENNAYTDNFKELIKSETATQEISENLSFYKFLSLNALTKNCIEFIINSLDVFSNGSSKIRNYFPDSFYFDENWIFEKALKYSLTLPERALFHAYIKYLILHKEDRSNFYQWMRVVHNLTENSRIENDEQFISAIKSIEKLLPHSIDILKYLVSPKCSIDFFSNWQVEEEILKAILTQKSEKWKTIIESAEKASFHRGQIAYLFEFSGIYNYFIINRDFRWSDYDDETYFSSFNNYLKKSQSLFSIFDTKKNETFLLERALLSKRNYLIPASQGRLNFCSSKRVANYQRDYSWKRLLRCSADKEEDLSWSLRRKAVKELLDDPNFVSDKIEKSLSKICSRSTDDWRSYFIKNPDLIKYCSQGFINISNSEIELYKESQINHTHINMYIYNFYVEYICENEQDFLPFNEIYFKDVKNSEDSSYVYFKDWCHKRINYEIHLYHWANSYHLYYFKSKGNKAKAEYVKEVLDILEDNEFEWSEDDFSFIVEMKDEESTIVKIKTLISQINNL